MKYPNDHDHCETYNEGWNDGWRAGMEEGSKVAAIKLAYMQKQLEKTIRDVTNVLMYENNPKVIVSTHDLPDWLTVEEVDEEYGPLVKETEGKVY